MKKYSVEITETLQKTVTVAAENPEEALQKVREAYRDGLIVLDAADFVGPASFGVESCPLPEIHNKPSRENERGER